MLSIELKMSGDRGGFDGVSKRLRNARPLMEAIGWYAVSQAVNRLGSVLSQDEAAIRTGRLQSSLTVFEASASHVAAGSNVPYARQVHFGGRIEPSTVKALAIPLSERLKRSRLWPRDLDPSRERLTFLPVNRGKIVGVLVDESGALGYGTEPLFALARWVDQQPRPYLYWSDEDARHIAEDLWPIFLRDVGT